MSVVKSCEPVKGSCHACWVKVLNMLARTAQALLGAIACGGASGEQPLGRQMPQPAHQNQNPLHNVHNVHQALLLQQQMALLAQQKHAQQQLPPLTQMLELNTLLNTMREGGGCAAPGPSASLGNHIVAAAYRATAEGTATGAQGQKSKTAFLKSAGQSAAAGCESEGAASKRQSSIKEEAEVAREMAETIRLGGGKGMGEARDSKQASSDAKMGLGQSWGGDAGRGGAGKAPANGSCGARSRGRGRPALNLDVGGWIEKFGGPNCRVSQVSFLRG